MINQALLVTIKETIVVKLGKTVTKILTNLNKLHDLITAAEKKGNRQGDKVQIIAVTKEVSVERTQEAIDAGLSHLGENRPEGLQRKIAEIHADVHWHYIGSLQTRKVKQVINSIDYLHSLDRLSLAEEIEKRADRPVKCFVQVNVSGEESKHGLSIEEVLPFCRSVKEFYKDSSCRFNDHGTKYRRRSNHSLCFQAIKTMSTANSRARIRTRTLYRVINGHV